jgi:uroporphyrin-III C-methyltransferase/precorrin-2 dehydrogenase/sirohydrochlorin ferrochelatase
MYPLMLDLRGRPCLLVGAGRIAHRKLLQLLSEGASVTVVAPTAIDPVARLAAESAIRLHARRFVETDVEGCRLVLAATGDRAVDAQVAGAARARGIFVNVADVPELCDFHLPASVRRGDLHLAIGSGGGAPFAVRRLREIFERRIGPAWADWMAAAKRFRQRVTARGLSAAEADACYDRFFAGTVEPHTLAARVPTEREEAEWSLPAGSSAPLADAEPPLGHVSLVGAGPGNPGLITVAGMNRLRSADAVVYDRLSIPTLPLDLPDTVELYPVGKEAGHHPVPQEEINALLLRLARMGKRVVRLKGGDPFVFARGGEELAVLRGAGIPCEAIPGVTAGIAVPAAADIPVTYRGEAVRLSFVTGHEGGAPGGAPQVRWDLLAQDTHATLVGYMGVSTLAEVSAALIAGGMNPSTPAAVIAQGTLPGQRSVRAPLSELAAAAKSSGIRPPAIFVIGQVVAHAEALESRAPRPLRGARIGLFAPAGELGDALQAAGAEVLLAPDPLTAAARLVIVSGPLSGWIVRTPRELEALERERAAHGFLQGGTLWCVGASLTALARARSCPNVAELDGNSPPHVVAKLREALDAPSGMPAAR